MSEQEWRITDGDRHSALQALGEHYAVGRLDKAEYDERSEQALAARTNLDLRPLFADLPAPHGPAASTAQTRRDPPPEGRSGPGPVRFGRRGYPFPVPAVAAVLMVVLVVVVLSHGFFVLPLLFLGFWVLRAVRWHGYHRGW